MVSENKSNPEKNLGARILDSLDFTPGWVDTLGIGATLYAVDVKRGARQRLTDFANWYSDREEGADLLQAGGVAVEAPGDFKEIDRWYEEHPDTRVVEPLTNRTTHK